MEVLLAATVAGEQEAALGAKAAACLWLTYAATLLCTSLTTSGCVQSIRPSS